MAAPQNFVSVSRRPPDVEDYIDILRRYRSWVIGPTFAGLVISVVVAFWWPDMYMCTASMQIKPGAAQNIMPSVLSGQMAQRLSQLNLEIMARDNLIAMITNPKLDLYKKERQRYTNEDVAQDYFAKHLRITPMQDGDNRGSQAFRISFDYPDRNKARLVVADLITQFQNKNIVLQSNTAQSAEVFLDDVVKSARTKMEAAQQAVANFSTENQGRLPENWQGNVMEVQGRQAALANLNDQIASEKQSATLLESALNNNKNMQSQADANLTQTQTTANQSVKNQNLTMLEGMIAGKRSELQALLRKYQPSFPDVLTVKDQIKGLEEQRDEILKEEASLGTGKPGTTVTTVKNPAAEQQLTVLRNEEANIRARQQASAMAIENLQRKVVEANRQLKEAQDKVAASPPVVQKYNQLQEDLAMARAEYQNLSSKKGVSETQQSMESHQAGERLDVLEQPIAPDTPYSPQRAAIVGIGTMIGLALGFALAGAKEIKNTSLKNLKDVRAYTNLPVLSSIPLLENALLVRRKRRLAWLAWSSAIIVGGFLMTGAVYYHFVIAAQQAS